MNETKKEQEAQETIEKMSEIHSQIMNLIAEYNQLSLSTEENEYGETPECFALVVGNEYGGATFLTADDESAGWFPSMVC